MNAVPVDHPDPESLWAYGLGKLGEATAAAVHEHLKSCDECRRAVESASDDTLAALVRASATQADSPTGPAPPPALPQEAGVPPALAGHPRYQVLGLLGTGGMGAVYKARHRLMERAVALKVINKRLTGNSAWVERFRREVRAAARLAHPNIVTAHDAEQAGDTHFLVMEYVPGVNLAEVVKKKGPLPVAHACHYARQAALGLQHAFEQGMVHRDIKPHNLMLTTKGRIKILDFGLARFASESGPAPPASPGGLSKLATLTQAGAVMGTPDYIAPEQATDARKADTRADIYSLGCTLYFLLTGRPPFARGTALQRILAHAEQAPEPVTACRPDVPAELAAVLERMMAKDPARRYQTPAEVAGALAPFISPATTPAPTRDEPADTQAGAGGALAETVGLIWARITDDSPQEDVVVKPARSRRRLGPVAAAAALVLVGLAIAVAVAVYRIRTDEGELVITTESDDVKVVIKQGGKLVRIVDTKTDKQVALALRSGVYELELKGAPKELRLSIDKAMLARGDTVIARIVRVENDKTKQRAQAEGKEKPQVTADPPTLQPPHHTSRPEEEYLIESALKNGMVLDVKDARGEDFAPIQLAGPENQRNRRWRLISVGKGEYLIESALKKGMVLDVKDARAEEGARIQLCGERDPGNQGTNRRWKLIPTGGSSEYQIESALKEALVLEVKDGKAGNGAPIQVGEAGNEAKQRWRLVRVPPPAAATIDRVRKDEGKPQVTARPPILPPLHRIRWPEGVLYSVELSPDNRYVVAGKYFPPPPGRPHTERPKWEVARMWHLETGKFFRDLPRTETARFTPDGKQVLSAERMATFTLRNVATGKVVRRFGWPQQGYSGLSLSSSGTRGVTYLPGPPGKFLVFDWSTGKALCQHDPGDRVLLTSDGRYVFRQQGTPPRLRAYDARTGKKVNAYQQLRHVPLIHSMSRNGKSLLCSLLCGAGHNLKVYDVDSGKEIGSFDAGINPKGWLSGDGRRLLATAGYRSILNVWDVRTRRVIARLRFPEPLEGGNGVQWQFSADGLWAAFAGPTDFVYVFRLPAPGEPAKADLDKARDRR